MKSIFTIFSLIAFSQLLSAQALIVNKNDGSKTSFPLSDVKSITFESSSIPTNGLVAYYPFNGNANDESGNGWNGTVNGATITTDRKGNLNKAYAFNGVNNYISTNYPGILGSQQRTISVWIKLNKKQSSEFLSYGNITDYYTAFRCLTNNNEIESIAIVGNYAINHYAINQDLMNWHNVVYVVPNISSPTFNDVKIYYDGKILENPHSISWGAGNGINTTKGQNLYIGVNESYKNYFSGLIDDIRIYNRALTEQEIQALYKE